MMRWMWDAQDLWIDPARLVAAGHSTKFTGTAGDDRLKGTDGRDSFDVSQGGEDVVRGGNGDDVVRFGAAFSSGDVVKGGEGNDKVLIAGHYMSSIFLDSSHLTGAETFKVGGSNTFNYTIDVSEGFNSIRVDARGAGVVNVDGSALTSGSMQILDSGLPGTLIGGQGDDRLIGGVGGDHLTGGDGKDRFEYRSKFDSENQFFQNNVDTISDFSQGDKILLPVGSNNPVSYHVGVTAERVGDVIASYSAADDITTLNVFMNSDEVADMTIYLDGDRSAIDIVHGSHVILDGV